MITKVIVLAYYHIIMYYLGNIGFIPIIKQSVATSKLLNNSAIFHIFFEKAYLSIFDEIYNLLDILSIILR